jgi:hypothetical protein
VDRLLTHKLVASRLDNAFAAHWFHRAKKMGADQAPLVFWEEQTSSGTRLEHLALAASNLIGAYIFFFLVAFFGAYGFTALKFLSFLASKTIGTQKNAAAGAGLNATAPTMMVAAATMIAFFIGRPSIGVLISNPCDWSVDWTKLKQAQQRDQMPRGG